VHGPSVATLSTVTVEGRRRSPASTPLDQTRCSSEEDLTSQSCV
jgi:hypothetical protein